MEILHITNEFSKKNYSIASLIVHISKLLTANVKNDVRILTTKLDVELFNNKNIIVVKFLTWIQFFFNRSEIKKNINSFELIHIHGIWAPIQLVSIIYCNNYDKKFIIHPHGMLLDEALSSAGKIKYILKKITLFLLKIFLNEKLHFVSITRQETEAIMKYFPFSEIKEIPNTIPFELSNTHKEKKLKKFVYFGRIHPHKNVELLINSFDQSNLDSEWSLEIYGIRDDEVYYKKLQKLIKHKKNIKIFNPVFGKERQDIMSSAWANILVSKSEVLSLSILESAYYGLPTITNKNIDLSNFKEFAIYSENALPAISKNINELSKWTDEYRNHVESNIKSISRDHINQDVTRDKYFNFYNSIEKTLFKTKEYDEVGTEIISRKTLGFLLVSSVYTFNLMFSSLFIILLVFFGRYNLAAEIGLITSFWISITQIFSSNMRGIITSENNFKLAKGTLSYRFIFSLVSIFLFLFLFLNNSNYIEYNLTLAISCLILAQWIFEMNIVKYELTNKYRLFYVFLFINILFIASVIFFLITQNTQGIVVLISAYVLIILSMCAKDLYSYFIDKNKYFLESLRYNLQSVAFVSSFSIISSSFIWRIIIYNLFEKSIAGIFFACFSIGSFPGTLFNSVIGPTFVKRKININKNLINFAKFIFFIILFVFIYSTFKFLNDNSISYISFEFISLITSISLLGSYFMCYAMYLRHRNIQENLFERQSLFKTDIAYGMSITIFIPVLYLVGGIFGASFAFFFASIFAFTIYSSKSIKTR